MGLLCPWDFPGKSTGVGCHFLLQRIFPTQGSNPDLPHCRQTLYCLNHKGSFYYVDHNKLLKSVKEMGIPDHLTWLLRNLYAGQEAIVRTGHGTTDWFQIGKGVHQGYILSPCLFNLYAKYIMRNTGPGEAQTGINIAGRNINNLRYADDTNLMAES